jgi:hypothetical protein
LALAQGVLADGPALQHLPAQHTKPELQQMPLVPLALGQQVCFAQVVQQVPLQQDLPEPQQ